MPQSPGRLRRGRRTRLILASRFQNSLDSIDTLLEAGADRLCAGGLNRGSTAVRGGTADDDGYVGLRHYPGQPERQYFGIRVERAREYDRVAAGLSSGRGNLLQWHVRSEQDQPVTTIVQGEGQHE